MNSKFNPTSLFRESNFRIQFRNDTPAIELMVTVANIPGFNVGELSIPRPGITDKRPGQQLTFDDLTVTVNCDETLETFNEIYTYLFHVSDPFTANYTIDFPIFDGVLFLTTNKNNIQHIIRFYNCFFKSISPINLKAITNDESHVTFDLTLSYTFFTFESNNLN